VEWVRTFLEKFPPLNIAQASAKAFVGKSRHRGQRLPWYHQKFHSLFGSQLE
jgi:hypothetical protein